MILKLLLYAIKNTAWVQMIMPEYIRLTFHRIVMIDREPYWEPYIWEGYPGAAFLSATSFRCCYWFIRYYFYFLRIFVFGIIITNVLDSAVPIVPLEEASNYFCYQRSLLDETAPISINILFDFETDFSESLKDSEKKPCDYHVIIFGFTCFIYFIKIWYE